MTIVDERGKRRRKRLEKRHMREFSHEKRLEWFFDSQPDLFPKHETLGKSYVFHSSRWEGCPR